MPLAVSASPRPISDSTNSRSGFQSLRRTEPRSPDEVLVSATGFGNGSYAYAINSLSISRVVPTFAATIATTRPPGVVTSSGESTSRNVSGSAASRTVFPQAAMRRGPRGACVARGGEIAQAVGDVVAHREQAARDRRQGRDALVRRQVPVAAAHGEAVGVPDGRTDANFHGQQQDRASWPESPPAVGSPSGQSTRHPLDGREQFHHDGGDPAKVRGAKRSFHSRETSGTSTNVEPPTGYMSSTPGFHSTDAPLRPHSSRSASNVLGYREKSSCGANCVGLTNNDTRRNRCRAGLVRRAIRVRRAELPSWGRTDRRATAALFGKNLPQFGDAGDDDRSGGGHVATRGGRKKWNNPERRGAPGLMRLRTNTNPTGFALRIPVPWSSVECDKGANPPPGTATYRLHPAAVRGRFVGDDRAQMRAVRGEDQHAPRSRCEDIAGGVHFHAVRQPLALTDHFRGIEEQLAGPQRSVFLDREGGPRRVLRVGLGDVQRLSSGENAMPLGYLISFVSSVNSPVAERR